MGEDQYIAIKVRHKPFSVYLNFLAPAAVKGQECMFIEGANNGKMWAHGTGIKEKMFGTVSLNPDGNMAMAGQRYPLTQIGILNLTRRLIEVASEDVKYGECEVKYFKGAKINDRVCTCTQVVHPVAAEELPLQRRPDLRRRQVEHSRPLRGLRLAEGRRRPAGTDRGVHLPQHEVERRLDRLRFRHPQPGLPLP